MKITSSQISLGSRGFCRLELHQTSCVNICCEALQNVLLTTELHLHFLSAWREEMIYSFGWTVPLRVLKISRTQVGQWETTWVHLANRLTHDSSCGWMLTLSNARLSPASRRVLAVRPPCNSDTCHLLSGRHSNKDRNKDTLFVSGLTGGFSWIQYTVFIPSEAISPLTPTHHLGFVLESFRRLVLALTMN